jgi:arylsulfate sulfotransferase
MNNRLLTILCVLVLLYSCSKNDHPAPSDLIVPIEFTVSADSIKVDPYGYTPLSALVSFTTEKAGNTVIIVKGKHGAASDVVHRFNDAGTYHSIPVIGMYADYANTVLLRIVNSNGDTLEKSTVAITTGSLPEYMPTSITAQDFDTSAVEPGLTLVSSLSTFGITGEPTIPYFLDNWGDVRWVLNYESNSELSSLFYDDGIARLRNGNFYFGNAQTGKIYEVDLLGKILNTWSMPGYSFHHNVQEKPNGNFVVSVTKQGSTGTNGDDTEEDYIIEINRQTGAIDNVWDLKQSLNPYRTALTTNMHDWIHVNSVVYDSSDNTIIISGRTQGVVKLDDKNNVVWILGAHADWGTNGRGEDLNQFLLTPLDASGNPITDTAVTNGWTSRDDFEWNWYQHSNILLPNGDIMVFDNGTTRTVYNISDGTNIYNSAPGKYSRAVEYKIDAANKTVQQVWSYGKERDQACYASIISSVQYLPETNHILFAPGFNVLNANGVGGKIVEVDYATKQVVAETSINTANKFAFHRAKKMSAYPDNM